MNLQLIKYKRVKDMMCYLEMSFEPLVDWLVRTYRPVPRNRNEAQTSKNT